MGFLNRLFGGGAQDPEAPPEDDGPFMEHPGEEEFASAQEALIATMQRLHALDPWDRPITISGQGQGPHADAYHIEELQVLDSQIHLEDRELDLESVLAEAGLTRDGVGLDRGEGSITLARASPEEMGRFLDALFRVGLGVRPWDDEADYAVGAEW